MAQTKILILRRWELWLIEDWQKFYKLSSMRLLAFSTGLWYLLPHLLGALSDQFPSAAPFLAHIFPKADPTLWPALEALIVFLGRITSFERRQDQ